MSKIRDRHILLSVAVFLAAAVIVRTAIVQDQHAKVIEAGRTAFTNSCEEEAAKHMSQPVIYCACARKQYEDYQGNKAYKEDTLPPAVVENVKNVCSH